MARLDLSRGLILVDKPVGLTSFGVISRLRKLTGIKKIGHSGTLDPFATGLLPILIGRFTRLAQYLESGTKTYRLSLVLGEARDSLDRTGEVTECLSPEDRERLEGEIKDGSLEARFCDLLKQEFTGKIEQIPPMYSAVKQDGQRLYHYARKGITVDRQARPVEIYQAELSAPYKDEAGAWAMDGLLTCSKGTYVRTWVDDLARRAGYLAYTKQLRRLASGHLSLSETEQAGKLVDLDTLFTIYHDHGGDQAYMRQYLAQTCLYPIDRALGDFASYDLNQVEADRVLKGQKLYLKRTKLQGQTGQITKLLYNNHLLAMADTDPNGQEPVSYRQVLGLEE